MNQINIKHIAHLGNECLRGIEFYKQELGFLNERLEDVARGNTGKETAIGIEHFQNQFIIHRNYLDELGHLFHGNNKHIEQQLLKTTIFVEAGTGLEHLHLYDQYLNEEKIFNELRQEFNRFAAKWL